jgi:purine-cytosine permease-like protein
MIQRFKKFFGGLAVAGFSALSMVLCGVTSAHATDIDDLFAAVNITGISTNVKTLQLGFITIGLLFLGYRYVKKVMGWA